jgi:shikimate kinase
MGHKHLVLIGLMGAGKTTVGRQCARQLQRDFVDTDDMVVLLAGMRVEDVFRTRGEPGFRDLEREAVADACASPAPLVIACGGGTVLDPENRRKLRAAGVIVWLRAPVPVLAARVGDGATRPLLAGDPTGALTRLEKLREPVYDAAAHRVVDTEDADICGVADAVIDAYEEAGP